MGIRRLSGWMVLAVVLWVSPARAASPALLGHVTAPAAIIIDYHSGEVLFARNPDLELPPASTTKILTAYIALRSDRLGSFVRVSQYASSMQPSKIGLRPGWAMNLNDLVYAILLNSANDAAVAIAEGLSGSVEEFAARMNRTAWQLGALNSHFMNPSGLPDSDHYTTVRDLTTIMRHAMQIDEFTEILSTPTTAIYPAGGARRAISLRSHNRLLEDPRTRVIGKTGFTRIAKKCFVGAASQNGRQVLLAVLGSSNLWGDLRRMIDWTFDNPTAPSLDNDQPDNVEWQQAAAAPVGIPRPQRRVDDASGDASYTTRQRHTPARKQQTFHVQVGTFRTRQDAMHFRKRLAASGYTSVVSELTAQRQRRFRVSVVGLQSRATAMKVAQTLKRAYRLEVQVVAADA